MNRGKPDKRTILRYIVMQLPGMLLAGAAALVVSRATDWPEWILWMLLGLWVLKDVLLFFWVWPSYRPAGSNEDPLVAQTGIVVRSCRPEGTVEIHGTPWRAVNASDAGTLRQGTRVRVIKRDGLILFVRPD